MENNIDKEKIFLDNMGNRMKLAKENGCKLLDCKTIDNNIKLRLENIKLKSELETYKKIAEKLAEHISGRCHYIDAYSNSCDVIEDSCYEDKDCEQCIIDWARKEVENGN